MDNARARTFAYWMVAAGLLGLVAVVGFVGIGASYQGYDYKCLIEGPFRESPPLALVSEAVEVSGRFSLWPLGRACDWERADGQGFVAAEPGWAATVGALGCASVAVAGRLFLTADDRRARVDGTK